MEKFKKDTALNILKKEVSYSNNKFKKKTKMAKNFLKHLLEREQEKRVTVTKALKHPWF